MSIVSSECTRSEFNPDRDFSQDISQYSKYLQDVSRVPVNFVTSLTKVISKDLIIVDVTGFSIAMLENIKCESLRLESLTIASAAINHDFSFSINKITLSRISGDVNGLLDLVGHFDSLEEIEMTDMDVSGQGYIRWGL